MFIKTFAPDEKLPDGIIIPEQVHGANIIEIKTGLEDISNCDGLWTENFMKILGVKTADCAPICFWQDDRFGIIHVGWRGLVNGIIEKMLVLFDKPNVWVGPFLPKFEIQKDECFKRIKERFSSNFLLENKDKIIFDLEKAIRSLLPNADFDGRSTFEDLKLASWRRDKTSSRNVTVIGNN
ncbi:MAG: polyphenol oxidase family protein [Patescibacteria group bacterium]|nr:polyphenol oxidase family protein [Patescibacteria group bacterium]